jgi:hypothetical protein
MQMPLNAIIVGLAGILLLAFFGMLLQCLFYMATRYPAAIRYLVLFGFAVDTAGSNGRYSIATEYVVRFFILMVVVDLISVAIRHYAGLCKKAVDPARIDL